MKTRITTDYVVGFNTPDEVRRAQRQIVVCGLEAEWAGPVDLETIRDVVDMITPDPAWIRQPYAEWPVPKEKGKRR